MTCSKVISKETIGNMAEDELDLALELSRDLNLAAQNDAQKDKAVWEHEDLAQVHSKFKNN